MTDKAKLIMTLAEIGFSDDSGNSIPTCENRFCVYTDRVVISNGYNICTFRFTQQGRYIINEHK